MARPRVEASLRHAGWRSLSNAMHCFGFMPTQFAIAVKYPPLYNRSPIKSQVECGVPEAAIPAMPRAAAGPN